MHKKNKMGGLKSILLGTTMAISSILPSFGQVAHPEYYENDSFRACMVPYARTNIHMIEGRDSLDYNHSGDANGDNILDMKDVIAIEQGTYTNARAADFNPDGVVNQADADSLSAGLNGEKEIRWEYMNRSERIERLNQILVLDQGNYPPENAPKTWDCDNYVKSHQKTFFGIEGVENTIYGNEMYGENAIENIPVYDVNLYNSVGELHSVTAILAGPVSDERLSENPNDFSNWYFWNPSGTVELEELKPGMPNMALNTNVSINWYGKIQNGFYETIEIIKFELVDGEPQKDVKTDPYLIPYNPTLDTITILGVMEDVEVNYGTEISGYLAQMPTEISAKTNLPTSLEKKVVEIPLNSEYPELHKKYEVSYKASTGYASIVKVRNIVVRDNEAAVISNMPENSKENYSVNLNLEDKVNLDDLNVTDNSSEAVKLEKSTRSTQIMDGSVNQVNYDFYTDVTATDVLNNKSIYTHKTEVRDIEAPKGYLISYSVKKGDNQSIEDAVNSIVDIKGDNSNLPIELNVERTTGNYYEVNLVDVAGNENYLGEVQVDGATSTGKVSALEKKCGLVVMPNPNPKEIRYYQPNFGKTKITTYNLNGSEVGSSWYNSNAGENIVSYEWDLSPGAYAVTMSSETCDVASKIIVSKK